MIFYTGGNKVLMNVSRVNPLYQNNRNWAIVNKTKGRNATFCAVSSTALGCIKTVTEKDSFINRTLDFGQKVSEAFRNLEQYSLYKRENDDLDLDKRQRPLAGNIGDIACNYETKVNPIAVPGASLIGGNIGEAYSIISNWFNAIWWRIRPACEKLDVEKLKLVPFYARRLCHKQLQERKQARKSLTEIIAPIFGLGGCFFAGIFIPIKTWNKLKENETKWIDSCADSAFLTQHSLYFLKFTLDELFEAQKTNNNNRWYLFGAGLAANIMNIGLPLVNILPVSDRTKTLWRELAQGLSRIFFSSRRLIKGKEWLERNS